MSTTLSLHEIARRAGVGRAAVANWRRHYPDFPAPSGDTGHSPRFPEDAVTGWLHSHGKIPVQPTPRDTAGGRMAALQLASLMVGNDFATNQVLETHVAGLTGTERAQLDLLRNFATIADVSTSVVPVLMGVGEQAVAALTTLRGADGVADWLRIQTLAVEEHADPEQHLGDLVVLAAASITNDEAVRDGDDPRIPHGRIWRRVTSWIRPGYEAEDRVDLLLSGGWLAASCWFHVFGGDRERAAAHLLTTSLKFRNYDTEEGSA
ncbi:helix-turn-helix transcriptional regulator [Streptomyces yaizuensis]|uniref:Uncharacterized protein n=1 Tax=Streptomyces yaizuensis TaxID=2989713 RepID=A0AA86IVC5_9ACTN|nr:hypothetical protein [Streptomyces sp. YSPA8]BDT39479.1 hypothetical protein SYYSPA8_36805 [Streptomyces sp. YSPA8]